MLDGPMSSPSHLNLISSQSEVGGRQHRLYLYGISHLQDGCVFKFVVWVKEKNGCIFHDLSRGVIVEVLNATPMDERRVGWIGQTLSCRE